MNRPEEQMLYPRSAFVGHLASILVLLTFVTALSGPAEAQPAAEALKIVTLQGEGAVNDIKSKTITEPVVEIRDSRELPVSDAEVVFQLPAMGPGGIFPDRSRVLVTRTNGQGQAAAAGLLPNNETGRFNIKVTANSSGRTAAAIIAQTNSRDLSASVRSASRSKSRRWIIIAAVVGAGAVAGGVYAATRPGPTPPPPVVPVISVTTGPVTVGGPH
jgi:hypothetical protein